MERAGGVTGVRHPNWGWWKDSVKKKAPPAPVVKESQALHPWKS